MAASFLHGVETIVVNSGPVPVRVVKSGVISLVGTAPIGAAQTLKLVNNPVDAAQFGSAVIPGFTIPKSLNAIFAQGAGTVEVVNVYDATSHNDSVTGETAAVVNGKAVLDHYPLDNISLENQASQALTEGTHYTINSKGEVVLTNTALITIPEVRSQATFTVTAGTSSAGVNKISSITVNGVNILSGAVDWVTSHTATAAAVVSNATAHTSVPEYTVTNVGAEVTIKALTGTGAAPNGFVVVVTVAGDVAVTGVSPLAGGVTGFAAATSITADYDWFNPANVTSSDIIGAVTSGTRTGLEMFDQSYSMFGFVPKIIIAPEFSQLTAVRAAMETKADKYRAKALVDGVEGWTVDQAIADRGPSGGPFNTSNKNSLLCYPKVKRLDAYTNADELFPFSAFVAGVIASTDLDFGFHVSPSNKQIKGITGIERELTFAPNDSNTEVNDLNDAGIVTIANASGTGFRVWGNRSASYPSSTDISNFICVDRTANIIDESLEYASLQFVDKPLTQPLIDSIRETGNSFIRTLIAREALIDGLVSYDPAKNSPTELAAGHITFDITYLPPTPAERITYERFIDINFFNNLA